MSTHMGPYYPLTFPLFCRRGWGEGNPHTVGPPLSSVGVFTDAKSYYARYSYPSMVV